MAISKNALRSWPHNGQPSALHEWKSVGMGTGVGGYTAKCDRCARTFIERADTRGPVYCYPTPQWTADHPADDGALGVDASGRRCGEYGRPL